MTARIAVICNSLVITVIRIMPMDKYPTPQDMLDAYYDGQVDFNNIISCFDECGVDFDVDDLTGMIELL